MSDENAQSTPDADIDLDMTANTETRLPFAYVAKSLDIQNLVGARTVPSSASNLLQAIQTAGTLLFKR